MQKEVFKDKTASTKFDIPVSSENQDIIAAAKGSGVLFIGQIIEQVTLVIFTILVTRTLGASSYGLYSLGVGVALILATIAMLGLPEGMMRFLPISTSDNDGEKRSSTLFIGIGLSTTIGLCIGIIFYCLGEFLATNLFHEPSAVNVIRMFSVIIPLEAVGRVLLGAAIGLKQVDHRTYSYSIGFCLGRLCLTVLFLFVGLDIAGLIIAYSLSWVLTIGLLTYFINRALPLNSKVDVQWSEIRKIVSFSAPLCLTEITLQSSGYIDLFLIGIMSTMTSVGVYSAVTKVQMAGSLLLTPVVSIAKPMISELHHQSETKRLTQLYQTLSRWTLSLILPLIVTIILFSRSILSIFGDEFVTGHPVLLLVTFGLLINAATRMCQSMISMTGHPKVTFFTTLFGLILNVILDIIFIPRWGMVGSAFGSLLVFTVLGFIRLFFIYFVVGIWPYNSTIIKPLLAAMIALLAGFLTNHLFPATSSLFLLILDVLILCSIYIAAIALLGLTEEDRGILFRVGKRLKHMLYS
jgi:O-antigen/teichoic acid export membrane protein